MTLKRRVSRRSFRRESLFAERGESGSCRTWPLSCMDEPPGRISHDGIARYSDRVLNAEAGVLDEGLSCERQLKLGGITEVAYRAFVLSKNPTMGFGLGRKLF